MPETDVIHLGNVYDLSEWRDASLQGRLDLVRRLLEELKDCLVLHRDEKPFLKPLAYAGVTLEEAIGHLRSERKFFRDLLTVDPEPDAGVEAAAPLQPGDVVVGGEVRHEPPLDLDRAEARAVVKGACRAVAASTLAEPVQPLGGALRDLARAIDDMHAEIEGEA